VGSQHRIHSAAEATANIAIGYTVAVAAQMVIFPLFDLQADIGDHLLIGALFTAVSLVRSYALRRLFNKIT